MKIKDQIVFLLVTLLIISCGNEKKEKKGTGETGDKAANVSEENFSASPFLTKDHQGRPVLSWIEKKNDSSEAYMCFAVSEDSGKTFGRKNIITTAKGVQPHDENLPKIIFKPGGEIIAVFGIANPNPVNKFSGLVFYTQSFDEGKSWSEVKPLVNDPSGFDQRYFDVVLLPDGEAGIIWLDNRKRTKKEGSTLYFAKTRGNSGFRDKKILAETICPCCRTDLFIDGNQYIHATFRDIINDTIRDMAHLVSTDQGKTFSSPVRISADNWKIDGCPHTGPSMTFNSTGLHFAWYTMGGGEGVFYCRSEDQGKTYSDRESVSSLPSAKHPQIATLSDDKIILVWDETEKNEKGKIGVQVRNKEGEEISKIFLTETDASLMYPVILPLGKNVLIACTVKINKTKKVFYRLIKV